MLVLVSLVPTTTSTLEPPSIAYLTRSWGNLSSESPLVVAWRVTEWCEGAGARQRTATAQHHVERA